MRTFARGILNTSAGAAGSAGGESEGEPGFVLVGADVAVSEIDWRWWRLGWLRLLLCLVPRSLGIARQRGPVNV